MSQTALFFMCYNTNMSENELKLSNLDEEVFVTEYIKNFGNAVKAYMVAYPDCSVDSAKSLAYTMLQKPNIKSAIELRRKEFMNSLKITKEHVLLKILRLQSKTEEAEDFSNSLKACDMLAKIAGAYAPDTQVNVLINNAQVKEIEDYLFKNEQTIQENNAKEN